MRLMKALKRSRHSAPTKKDLHMLRSRGFPTDSKGAYKKMDDLFAESLRAQGKSRGRIANTLNNEKHLKEIDDRFNRLRGRISAHPARSKPAGPGLDRRHTMDHLGGYQPESDLSHLCLLYTSPSPRDGLLSRMPSSA